MSNPSPDVAVVTGAARGLGASIATALLKAGYRVAVTDISEDALAAFAAPDGIAADRVLTLVLDVREKAGFEAALARIVDTWGAAHVLVNCAALTRTTPLFDIAPEEFTEVMTVNLGSVFVGSQVFGAHFRDQGYGRIINIASLAAQNGGTATGAHYAASKGAIVTLTKVFARELAAAGVTVNAIAPGPLDVPLLREILPAEKLAGVPGMIPVGHLGDPGFIGKIACLLADRDASSMTGATLDANGGLYVR
ncbi:MAG: SDR family oxidoreductase [Novosphingobium sp.]|nr:SDR family oxidoreductase [Novosphingobium sp.]